MNTSGWRFGLAAVVFALLAIAFGVAGHDRVAAVEGLLASAALIAFMLAVEERR